MAVVEIKGLAELINDIDDLKKNQLPFVIAQTLTEVAYIAKDKTVEKMKSVFDSPTPFTLNALKVDRATKTKPSAKVLLKDPTRIDDAKHYLNPAVEGGLRHFKSFEGRLYFKKIIPAGYYAVPVSKSDMDIYGNFNRGKITQILSYFDALPDAGFKSSMGAKGRTKLGKTTAKKYGISYFAIHPGTAGGLTPGIYQSINSNFGRAVKMLFLYAKKSTYTKRIDLQQIADSTYSSSFKDAFSRNFVDAVNSAFK